MKGQRTENDLVRLAGVVAQHATIAAVSRMRDTTTAADLVSFLESIWANYFGESFDPMGEFNAPFRS